MHTLHLPFFLAEDHMIWDPLWELSFSYRTSLEQFMHFLFYCFCLFGSWSTGFLFYWLIARTYMLLMAHHIIRYPWHIIGLLGKHIDITTKKFSQFLSLVGIQLLPIKRNFSFSSKPITAGTWTRSSFDPTIYEKTMMWFLLFLFLPLSRGIFTIFHRVFPNFQFFHNCHYLT